MDSFEQLVKKNRSYRRFDESKVVDRSTLVRLIELTRYCASTSNIQALKFYPVCDTAVRAQVFPCLHWAGYISEWDGPQPGERPVAYIVIVGDTDIRASFGMDPGIVAQTILLGASDMGLGGCMIGSMDKAQLRESMHLPSNHEVLLVIALGKPTETVVIEDAGPDGNIKYYRDADDVHHVPKRTLSEVLVDPPTGA